MKKKLAVTRVNPESGSLDLWLLELSTGILSRLMPDTSEDAQWSPDSREVIFSSSQKGYLDLFRKAVGGSGEKLVFQSDENKWTSQWLKDDSVLIENTPGTFYRLPLSGGQKPTVLLQAEFENNAPVVSSDGRWVAYQSKESGRWEIYLAAFPSFKERRQVSDDGGCQAHLRKDGKELFYLSLDGRMMSVELNAGASMSTSVPKALFRTPFFVDQYANPWDVAGDGKRFLIGEPLGEGGKPVIVVLNWAAGLKR